MTSKHHNLGNPAQSAEDAENEEGQKKMSEILAQLRIAELEGKIEYGSEIVAEWGAAEEEKDED